MSPLVSIIVPVYNTAEYVEECIQSILSQSYNNIELILVNDGSTDNSEDICRRHGHLSNVKYVEQKHNGPSKARENGLTMSNGEWIMFVDSDDTLHSDAVQFLLSLSEQVDIVVSSIVAENGDDIEIKLFSNYDYLRLLYSKEITSSPCAKLYRRTLFNDKTFNFPQHISRWEDLLMNLQIACDNQHYVRVTNRNVYFRRVRLSSTSNSNILSLDDLAEICRIEDSVIDGYLQGKDYVQARLKNRFVLFIHEIQKNGFVSDAHHPYVKDIKRCMNEAGVWKPMDRWLLSVSSPWAVKMVWNLRRVVMRLAHPSIIINDVKKLI